MVGEGAPLDADASTLSAAASLNQTPKPSSRARKPEASWQAGQAARPVAARRPRQARSR